MVLVSNIIVILVCSSTTLKSLSSNITNNKPEAHGSQVSWDHAQAKEDIHVILWIDPLYKQERPTTLSKLVLDAWSQRRLQLRPATNHAKYACMLSEAFQEQQEFTSSDLWTIYRKHAECYLSCNLLCYIIYSVRQEFSLSHLKT